MTQLLIEYKTKEPVLLLPESTLRKVDDNLKMFPNFLPKYQPVLRKGKHWKPQTSELEVMKKKLDKLVPEYEQVKAFGQVVRAKRIFKKALQISKRISVILGRD